jgi:SAGA-associated factor 73
MAASSSARKGVSSDKSKQYDASTSFLVKPKPSSKKVLKPFLFKRKADNLKTKSTKGTWDNKSASQIAKIPVPQLGDNNELISMPPALIVNGLGKSKVSPSNAGKAFDDSNDPVQCKHCKKAIFISTATDHIHTCLRKKQEKLQRKKEAKEAKDAALRKERNGGISPDGDDRGSKKTLGDGLSGAKKTGKKRNVDDDDKGTSKKRKKDEKNGKGAKAKGPVDVEKQCGVLLPNGSMCARSLTCKSHSMGAKRSVPGRSKPYDHLLQEYQKKSHARQHRAALNANAPLPDDFDAPTNVDSDEERDVIMAAISSYCVSDPITGAPVMGSPLAERTYIPIRRRYNHIRLKEAMRSALDGAEPGTRLFSAPSPSNTAALMSAT